MNPSRNPPAAVIALRRLIIKMRWHSQCATPEEIRSWADDLDALVARVELPPQEQDVIIGAIHGVVDTWRSRKRAGLWLADAELELTRCTDELDGLRAVLAAHRAPPTQEPTKE